MRPSTSLITLFTTASMMFVVRAGTIACLNGQLSGGVGLIPVHNPEFNIDGETFIGGPFPTNCGQMVGRPHDKNDKYEGGHGKTAMADFWITNDSCLNIETGGKHYFCCPGKINQDLHGLTTCNF